MSQTMTFLEESTGVNFMILDLAAKAEWNEDFRALEDVIHGMKGFEKQIRCYSEYMKCCDQGQ